MRANWESEVSQAFSIVIPTHNRPRFLLDAVTSALEECGTQGEVVVVDDRCDIPAQEVLSNLADPRLNVVENPGPNGAAGARNYGVACAGGQIIFFLDDDDQLETGYVARVLSRLGDGIGADYGYAAARVVWPDGSTQTTVRRLGTGLVPKGAAMRHKTCSAQAGFWIRRATFLELGGFDPRQMVDEDTDLCVRLAATGHLAWYDTQPGTKVRQQHSTPGAPGAQLTAVTSGTRAAACYLRSYEKSSPQLSPMGEGRWWLATRYIRRATKAGDGAAARQFARRQEPLPFRLALLGYWLLRTARARMHPSKAL